MPVVGAIADRTRGLIPITWDALEKDSRVGDAPLQSAINLAKERVTGQVIPYSQENLYPLIVIDYIAKVSAVEIIPSGIDYWMNQSTDVSSSGTNEHISYPDRAKQLEDIRQQFVTETRLNQLEISKIVNYYLDNGRAIPQMSSAAINPFHLTPSPEEFERPYKQTQYS